MNNSKTPVMVLQEFSVKKGWPCPEFTVIHAKQGTHENEFHYQVVVNEYVDVGIGRSKKDAKHDAAKKLLDKLSDLNIYSPDETVIKAPRSDVPGTTLKLVNTIGTLSDICVENKIRLPEFKSISDVGPPHCKEFTFECRIASFVTRGTAGTKKQAKQWAAKEMLDRISHILPELVAECSADNDNLAIMASDSIAYETYQKLTKFVKPKPNLSIKIPDYFLNLKNIADEKGIDTESMKELSLEPSEESLKLILEKFELDYCIEPIQENKVAVLTLSTDVPFTTLGIGEDYNDAVENVIRETFNYLKIFFE